MIPHIVINGGQKGGVGKTLFGLVLAHYLDANGITWRGVDTDPANKSFLAARPDDVAAFDIADAAGNVTDDRVNAFVDMLMSAPADVVLVDLGAGQQAPVLEGLRAAGVLDAVAAGDVQLTLAFTLVNSIDSVSTLKNCEICLDDVEQARWLVVRNERDGACEIYDKSALRGRMTERQAIETTLPATNAPALLPEVTRSKLGWSVFLNDASQSWAQRARLKKWLMACHENLEATGFLRTQAQVPEAAE